ncbi:hypothetical protein L1049_005212 [Liquidambar formosana]|uniref:Uncharacterized protein n=1 Tax=Liquidambar formosana TaxID=63359 RepID=A0AAP0RQV2_LIQFO
MSRRHTTLLWKTIHHIFCISVLHVSRYLSSWNNFHHIFCVSCESLHPMRHDHEMLSIVSYGYLVISIQLFCNDFDQTCASHVLGSSVFWFPPLYRETKFLEVIGWFILQR